MHQIEKLKLPGIARYKIQFETLVFWMCTEELVFRAMVDFGGGSNFSGIYHRVRLQQAPVQGGVRVKGPFSPTSVNWET